MLCDKYKEALIERRRAALRCPMRCMNTCKRASTVPRCWPANRLFLRRSMPDYKKPRTQSAFFFSA